MPDQREFRRLPEEELVFFWPVRLPFPEERVRFPEDVRLLKPPLLLRLFALCEDDLLLVRLEELPLPLPFDEPS